MFKFFSNLLFPKTVDSVVAQFNKVKADLQEVMDEQDLKAAEFKAQSVEFQRKADEAEREATRASRIQAKVAQLLA